MLECLFSLFIGLRYFMVFGIMSGSQTTAASAMGTQNNTSILGSCIDPKSAAGAGINSTTMNIDRFTRMNTPNFYMRQNVALFLDK
jgi:hypothetical protein